jgi:NADH-quinone oxidoreductase subunit N
LAGIPPLSGFLSKFLVFISLIEANSLKFLLFIIIISLISAYYYIRTIKIMVFSDHKTPKFFVEIPFFSALILILIFYFNIFLIIQPSILFNFLEERIILENFNLFTTLERSSFYYEIDILKYIYDLKK